MAIVIGKYKGQIYKYKYKYNFSNPNGIRTRIPILLGSKAVNTLPY